MPLLPGWIADTLRMYFAELAVLALFLAALLYMSRFSPRAREIPYEASLIVLSASSLAACYTTSYACPGIIIVIMTLLALARRRAFDNRLLAVPLLLAYSYYTIAVIYSVGNGSLIPAGYDEWSDLAAAHYISETGGLEEARAIRAGYYEYPILPAIESGLILVAGASPGLIQALLAITVASVYFLIIGFWPEDDKHASLLGAIIVLLMLFMNPRLRAWDVIPHIHVGIYALAMFYLLEKYKLNPGLIAVLALAGIVTHLVFLLFTVLYVARELTALGRQASRVKMHVLALVLTVSYVYYSSTGVLAYLLGEVFNVGVYERIPASLSTGTVPVYAYLLPLVSLSLTLFTGRLRRRIIDLATGAAVTLGILLGLSGKATYGRHLAASGYLFLKVENIDVRSVLGRIAKTLAGALLLSGAIAVGIVDAGGSLDWAPQKFCASGFSIPCLEDSEASRELSALLGNESLVGVRLLPEPRIDPALRYWLLVKDAGLAEKIDTKLVKDSRDSRMYPPSGVPDNTVLFYDSSLYPGLAENKSIIYNGYGRVLVVGGRLP